MILEELKKRRLYFDGATGTILQAMGLEAGQSPEEWNLTFPERICALHRSYLEAGADIIKANTFGINRLKFHDCEAYIRAAMSCAQKAVRECGRGWIAFDMGPCTILGGVWAFHILYFIFGVKTLKELQNFS